MLKQTLKKLCRRFCGSTFNRGEIPQLLFLSAIATNKPRNPTFSGAGGLIGYLENIVNGNITNGYWDITRTTDFGKPDSTEGLSIAGITTENMKGTDFCRVY